MCTSMSARLVFGRVNAMLWNGVIRIPPIRQVQMEETPRGSSSPAAAEEVPSRGAGGYETVSRARAEWVTDHGKPGPVDRVLHTPGKLRRKVDHVGERIVGQHVLESRAHRRDR